MATAAKPKSKTPAKKAPKKTAKKTKKPSAAPLSPLRLAARLVPLAVVSVVLVLCAVGDFYVHHPADWLQDHRSFISAPLEWFGDRTAFLTDALGWTGHDCVYETDDPIPEGEILFSGEPVRSAPPAPKDLVTLNRGDFLVGWSPSLRHPVWAAYHVPSKLRFEAGKRPAYTKDRSVESSPLPADYAHAGYDRGHMVPNFAIATRFGQDAQKKTFQMTNIAPQSPGLNRGPWREMEHRIAEFWTQKYGEMWVIVGAIPGTQTLPAAKNVSVPAQFYMVVVGQTSEGVRALAVLLDQNAKRGDFPVHNIVTIDELEKLSGLEFFPDMPKFLKTPLKLDRPTRLWPVRFRDLVKLILTRFI